MVEAKMQNSTNKKVKVSPVNEIQPQVIAPESPHEQEEEMVTI